MGGGTSKFPLLTLGRSQSLLPASRPLGLLAAPPTHGDCGFQGGTGAAEETRDPLPNPHPCEPRTGGRLSRARFGGSSGRRGLIIDWMIGVAEAPGGPGRGAQRRRWLARLRWRQGDEDSLTLVVRAPVGWNSLGRPSGGGGGAATRAGAARAAAHRCAAGSIASPWASS